mmetsp:Transcript_27849/g.36536  ORF Transcript_27849/g.36536 Transcript_27849/m.36536 type:complete len:218 (+) Transcript_27849:293-946(+)
MRCKNPSTSAPQSTNAPKFVTLVTIPQSSSPSSNSVSGSLSRSISRIFSDGRIERPSLLVIGSQNLISTFTSSPVSTTSEARTTHPSTSMSLMCSNPSLSAPISTKQPNFSTLVMTPVTSMPSSKEVKGCVISFSSFAFRRCAFTSLSFCCWADFTLKRSSRLRIAFGALLARLSAAAALFAWTIFKYSSCLDSFGTVWRSTYTFSIDFWSSETAFV